MAREDDFATTAALNQSYQQNRAFTAARRQVLEERRKELDALEAKNGPSDSIQALREGIREEHARLDAFSVGKATVHRVSIGYKAWLVFKPLIVWPLLAGVVPFLASMLIALVVIWTVSEETGNLVAIAGIMLSWTLMGLAGTVGMILAIIRLFSSRESLWMGLKPSQKARRAQKS